MNQKDKLLASVLKRNNYELIHSENSVSIKNIQNSNPQIKTLLIFSSILAVIGLGCALFFSLLFGIILLSSAIPLFIKINKLKEQSTELAKTTLEITASTLSLIEEEAEDKFDISEIKELHYTVEKDNDLSIGTIYIDLENEENYKILDIYGTDKRYVEDDVKIIANNLLVFLNE